MPATPDNKPSDPVAVMASIIINTPDGQRVAAAERVLRIAVLAMQPFRTDAEIASFLGELAAAYDERRAA